MTSQVVPDLLEGDRLEQLLDGLLARPELYLTWLMGWKSD